MQYDIAEYSLLLRKSLPPALPSSFIFLLLFFFSSSSSFVPSPSLDRVDLLWLEPTFIHCSDRRNWAVRPAEEESHQHKTRLCTTGLTSPPFVLKRSSFSFFFLFMRHFFHADRRLPGGHPWFRAVSASKERGILFLFFVFSFFSPLSYLCPIFIFLTLPRWGVAIKSITLKEQKATSVRSCVQTRALCATCRHVTHLTSKRHINHEPHKTPQHVRVSRCVYACVCMHECNPLIICVVLAPRLPLRCSGETRRGGSIIPTLLLFSTRLLLLFLLLFLSVLGKRLSFSEYLCILWHDTVKVCVGLCGAVSL